MSGWFADWLPGWPTSRMRPGALLRIRLAPDRRHAEHRVGRGQSSEPSWTPAALKAGPEPVERNETRHAGGWARWLSVVLTTRTSFYGPGLGCQQGWPAVTESQ